MKQRLSSWAIQLRWAAIIILPPTVAYALSLDAPFHFDTKKALLTTPILHRINDIGAIINFDPYLPRPLFHISLVLDWQLNNGLPFGFHLTNILWHIAAVLLLWKVLDKPAGKTGASPTLSAGAALLFGLHPILTESVTYIWGRSGVMSTVFMLVSLLFYLHARGENKTRLAPFLASVAAFIAALAAKETAAVLPLLLIGVEVACYDKRGFWKPFARTVPFPAFVALIFAWRLATYGRLVFDVEESYASHLARQVCVTAGYLRMLAWPFGLSVTHHVPDTYPAAQVAASAALIAAIATASVFFIKRKPLLWFAGVLFFAGLAPFFFIPLNDRMVERNLYLPAMGFALLLSTGIHSIAPKWRNVMLAAVAVCFFINTTARNRVWLTEYSLWKDAAQKAPLEARPRAQLGALALVAEDIERAERFLNGAIAIDTRNADAHNNLGVIYLQKGDVDRAGYEFASAINADNDHVEAHLNYIRTLIKRGDREKAEALLGKIVRRLPTLVAAKVMLGEIYRLQGQPLLAIELYRTAWRLDPENSSAALGAGLACLQARQKTEAHTWLVRSLHLKPKDTKAHRAMGMLLFGEGDFSAAAEEYEKALLYSPAPDLEILADLGIALMRAGRWNEAMAVFQRERDLRSSDPRPYLRLALLEEKKGNIAKAKAIYTKALELDRSGKLRPEIEAILKRLETLE